MPIVVHHGTNQGWLFARANHHEGIRLLQRYPMRKRWGHRQWPKLIVKTIAAGGHTRAHHDCVELARCHHRFVTALQTLQMVLIHND